MSRFGGNILGAVKSIRKNVRKRREERGGGLAGKGREIICNIVASRWRMLDSFGDAFLAFADNWAKEMVESGHQAPAWEKYREAARSIKALAAKLEPWVVKLCGHDPPPPPPEVMDGVKSFNAIGRRITHPLLTAVCGAMRYAANFMLITNGLFDTPVVQFAFTIHPVLRSLAAFLNTIAGDFAMVTRSFLAAAEFFCKEIPRGPIGRLLEAGMKVEQGAFPAPEMSGASGEEVALAGAGALASAAIAWNEAEGAKEDEKEEKGGGGGMAMGVHAPAPGDVEREGTEGKSEEVKEILNKTASLEQEQAAEIAQEVNQAQEQGTTAEVGGGAEQQQQHQHHMAPPSAKDLDRMEDMDRERDMHDEARRIPLDNKTPKEFLEEVKKRQQAEGELDRANRLKQQENRGGHAGEDAERAERNQRGYASQVTKREMARLRKEKQRALARGEVRERQKMSSRWNVLFKPFMSTSRPHMDIPQFTERPEADKDKMEEDTGELERARMRRGRPEAANDAASGAYMAVTMNPGMRPKPEHVGLMSKRWITNNR